MTRCRASQINESALVEHVLQDVIQMLRAGTKPALLLREEGNTKVSRPICYVTATPCPVLTILGYWPYTSSGAIL